jgi:arylsulfatase A-like enzyme
MHGLKTGVLNNGQWIRPDYQAQNIATWPERLAQVGYTSSAIGKMHFYPWYERMGFDYRSVTEDKRWPNIRDDYYKYLRGQGTRKFTGSEHEGYQEKRGAIISRNPWEHSWDHFVGTEAVDYINTYAKDEPFAMMVGFTGPHCPYDPNESFRDSVDLTKIPDPAPSVLEDCPLVKKANHDVNRLSWNGVDLDGWTLDEKRVVRQHYAALIEQIDYEVGCILDALEASGELENTLIIFSSDHGDYVGDHDMAGKGSFYEGSCHIPMIVCDPCQEEAAVCDDLVELMDLTSTILSYADVEIPKELDSIPLPGLPYLNRGRPDVAMRTSTLGWLNSGCMYLSGAWKYAKYSTGEITLFNLEDDPFEQENRAHRPESAAVLLECEQALSIQMLGQVYKGHHDKLVDGASWDNVAFGKESFVRQYPNPW